MNGGGMFKKSKIQLLRVFVLGILVALVGSVVGSTSSLAEVGQCGLQPIGFQLGAPHGGGGGEVPSLQVNQHVELAIGEYYSLYGTVVAGSENSSGTSMNSVPMFAVDLQQHPWLASAYRVRSPYYYLPGSWATWGRYLNKRVLLTAQAQAVWVTRPNGDRVIGISLLPVDAGAVTPTAPSLTSLKPAN